VDGGGEGDRFSQKQHQALKNHYYKLLTGAGDVKDQTRGTIERKGGGGGRVRFSPEEHAALIQRARTLQRGGRGVCGCVSGLGEVQGGGERGEVLRIDK